MALQRRDPPVLLRSDYPSPPKPSEASGTLSRVDALPSQTPPSLFSLNFKAFAELPHAQGGPTPSPPRCRPRRPFRPSAPLDPHATARDWLPPQLPAQTTGASDRAASPGKSVRIITSHAQGWSSRAGRSVEAELSTVISGFSSAAISSEGQTSAKPPRSPSSSQPASPTVPVVRAKSTPSMPRALGKPLLPQSAASIRVGSPSSHVTSQATPFPSVSREKKGPRPPSELHL